MRVDEFVFGQFAIKLRDLFVAVAGSGVLQGTCGFDRLSPFLFPLEDFQQRTTCLNGVRGFGQFTENFLGTIEQTGFQKILPQFIAGLHALFRRKVGAQQQVLVHTDGTFRFATPPEQVAQREVQIRGFRPDWACIRRITALGTSSFVMSFTDSLVQVACNATLRTFGGDLYISVMTVINSVRQIAQTPVMALTDGASPVISYNYGARSVPRVRKAIRFMTQLGFGYTMLIWALISLFPAAFIMIFNHDPDLLTAAVPSLHIYFFGFVMMAFQFSGQSVFKSLNKPKMAIFFSLLRKAIIVVPLTLLLPRIAGLGVNGVFLAEPISNFIGGLACYITMRCTVMPELKRIETPAPVR